MSLSLSGWWHYWDCQWEWAACFPGQATPASAQGETWIPKKHHRHLPAEALREGWRNQTCSTPDHLSSVTLPTGMVDSTHPRTFHQAGISLPLSLTESWIWELKRSSESCNLSSLPPSKAQIISTWDWCCLITSSDRKLTSHWRHSFHCCLARTSYSSFSHSEFLSYNMILVFNLWSLKM